MKGIRFCKCYNNPSLFVCYGVIDIWWWQKSKMSDHWHRPALSSILNLHLSLTQTMWLMLQDHLQASVMIKKKKHFRYQVCWKLLSGKSLKERRTFQPDFIMSCFIVFIKSCLNLKHIAYLWRDKRKEEAFIWQMVPLFPLSSRTLFLYRSVDEKLPTPFPLSFSLTFSP